MDNIHILLICVVFLVNTLQTQARTFTEEDCPGKYLKLFYYSFQNILFYCLVCVATIDKFSKTLEGETNLKNIENQFRKYCVSTKNDKEKRLVGKILFYIKMSTAF